jgi:hypothetical protein
MPERPAKPTPKDPKLCQLSHCPRLANGHDWMLGWDTRGEVWRAGFCSQAHLKIARDLLGDLSSDKVGWVMESDPEDNFEDRMLMRFQLEQKERRGGGGDDGSK